MSEIAVDLNVVFPDIRNGLDSPAARPANASALSMDNTNPLTVIDTRLAQLELAVGSLFDRSTTMLQTANDHEARLAEVERRVNELWSLVRELLGGNTRRRSQQTGYGW